MIKPLLQARSAFAPKTLFWAISCLFIQSSLAEEADASKPIEFSTIAITANPLGAESDAMVVPVYVLNGKELANRRESTLGDTLNGIPGVTATHFGPNASRPIIRGLDAERVRIMQNGVGVLDASSLSFDHAVTVDPLIIEQIDVVRGPAALLYGGSAVGGVVNAIDHRIPKEKLDGILGRVEGSIGGADSQNNLAGVVDAGTDAIVIHADAYTRKTSDLDIDGFAVSSRKARADGTARENKGKLVNSSADSEGGALGASFLFDNGYLGASYSGFRNNYGTVAEENVRADMRSDRVDVATEFRQLGNVVNRVKARMAYTDYQHQEIEDGEVGTTFNNTGVEGSVELGHAKLGNMEGVLGFQFQNTNFEALGDEAFVPSVNTQSKALYVYEELPMDALKLSFGGRVERVNVDAKDNDKFGAGQKNQFSPNSYALGGLYTFSPHWSLATNLSHNERAPSYFELYANGAHLATGQFEVGDADFDKERSNGIDAQLRWKNGKNSFNAGAYYTRFSNFIGLLNTGETDIDSGLPVAQFSTFAATFKGIEMDGKFAMTDHLNLTVRGDYVHAKNRDNNDNLPRISPLRLGAGLRYQQGSFGARLDVLRAFKQNRTAENELKTDGYSDVSAMVSYKFPVSKFNMELFAKGKNLLNQEIREHASFLKDIAPAGERALIIGARADF
ncbi:MAG TPA: TonB-dependent receptor [Methylotenera sp.]|nr:TonB-dependent receptor [Methylotenera sp.]HPH06241.1 TonB-dependent receptor [Methylotenera sp.]HPN00959.1 TonB-dependent receptor [Methylotenera sp.]